MQTQLLGVGRMKAMPVPSTKGRRVRHLVAAAGGVRNQETGKFDETLVKAQVKLKEWSEQASDTAQRTWRKLDAEYSIKDKAGRAARKLEEQARDVDQQYSVRRRIRSSLDHVQRMWPTWSKQLNQFASTWYGKTTVLAVVFFIISSPIFWRLLNFLLIVWWLAIPVAAALVSSAQRKQAERAAAAAEEQARRQNPFADIFRARGASSSRSSRRAEFEQSGPVIDADYIVLSSKDDK